MKLRHSHTTGWVRFGTKGVLSASISPAAMTTSPTDTLWSPRKSSGDRSRAQRPLAAARLTAAIAVIDRIPDAAPRAEDRARVVAFMPSAAFLSFSAVYDRRARTISLLPVAVSSGRAHTSMIGAKHTPGDGRCHGQLTDTGAPVKEEVKLPTRASGTASRP